MKTKIKLHGALGEQMGKSEWSLCVNSPREAIHAVNIQTNRKLYKQFSENDKAGIKYRVLIDGEDFLCPNKLNNSTNDEKAITEDLETLQNSELFMEKKIKRIDIIPVVEGASEVFMTVIGVLLIVVGIVFPPLAPFLIPAGLALVAAGISAMLMEPPEFGEIRKIEGMQTASYLFNGPVNSVKEGGVVPVIYGQVLAGSQVIAAYYKVYDVSAEAGSTTS